MDKAGPSFTLPGNVLQWIKTEQNIIIPVDNANLSDLICQACSRYFQDPKILDCLHSCCRPCLQHQIKIEDEVKAIKCPVCGEETKALSGVEGLTSNTTLRALVEEATLQEKISGDVSKVKCEACTEDITAISRCMDCDNFLCVECQHAHMRLIALSGHYIVTMADLQSGKVTFKSKLRDAIHKCSKHPDQNLCFFCKTCKMLICTTCTVLDHCKPDHSYTDIETAMDSCRSEVEYLKTQVEHSRDCFQDAEALTVQSESRLERLAIKAQEKISAKADKEVAKIRNVERRLKMAVQGTYNNRITILGKVKSKNSDKTKKAKLNLKKVGTVLSQSSHSEMLSLRPNIINSLKEIMHVKQTSVPYSLSYINFKESNSSKNLGKLLMGEKWVIKSTIGAEGENETIFDDILHVAPFPNGNILVFDRGHRQVMVVTPTGGHSEIQQDAPGWDSSTAIAVTSDDKIVITSNTAEKKVKKFDLEKNVSFDITPWGDSEELACLALVEGNQIAVGDRGRGRIGLLDENGTLLKTIPADMIGQYLTFSRATKHLIYTDYTNGRLISIDLNSNLIFCVETLDRSGNQVFPTGVSCDHTGDIYVAVQKSKCQSGQDKIYHYTREGEYARQVVMGLSDVFGITFNNDGALVVADSNTLKIYSTTINCSGNNK